MMNMEFADAPSIRTSPAVSPTTALATVTVTATTPALEKLPTQSTPTGEDSVVPVKRRGTVACRRCRRLRTRCIHDDASPPCEVCKVAGERVAEECMFPRRGEKDLDRQFRRRPAVPAESPSSGSTNMANVSSSPAASYRSASDRLSGFHARQGSMPFSVPSLSRDEILPPTEELVEGCRIFVTSYFQLGFIPKAVFLEKLVRRPESVSSFLLCCILSISARFTPSLTRRYGGAREATDHFLEVSRLMVPAEMYQSSLERLQAFFLLSISQWGDGDRERSSIDMGIAVRMAGLQRLHCEDSYEVSSDSSAEDIVRMESARRVFWMIQSQENLHSGYKTPAPFPLEDITTLLPCNEKDFAFGTVPVERAALPGTPPAIAHPQLATMPTRCLFATLIQAHSLWGAVSRKASRPESKSNKAPPWDSNSGYQATEKELQTWEQHLPPEHTFSVWNLRGWKSESLDLAYLAVTMVLRLTNIVSRRVYLDEILIALSPGSGNQRFEPSTPTMANAGDQDSHNSCPPPATATVSHDAHGTAPPGFWQRMSDEMFDNVWQLHQQIDAFLSMRTPDEGFPQILVFCIYMCGSVSSYLWRYPALCPRLADSAQTMAQRSLEALGMLHAAWPTSALWAKGLQKIATPFSAAVIHAEPEVTPTASAPPTEGGYRSILVEGSEGVTKPTGVHTAEQYSSMQPPVLQHHLMSGPPPGHLANSLPSGASGELAARFGGMQPGAMPGEVFDVELTAFMQGDFHFNQFDGMPHGNTAYHGVSDPTA